MDSIESLFVDVDSATIKPPAWVVENILPIGLTIIGGPPKLANKSIISMALAAIVTERAQHVLPVWCKLAQGMQGPVQAWSFEADSGEVKEMLEVGFGCKPKHDRSIIVARNPLDFQLDQHSHDDNVGVDELINWLKERDPRLAIFDPFRDMHTLDENDSAVVAKILAPIREWAHDANSAAIVVHHSTKPQAENVRHRAHNLRGSGAVFGKADAVLMSEPHGHHEGVISVHATFKRAPKWERVLSLGCPGFGWESIGKEILHDDTMRIIAAAIEFGNWDIKALAYTLKKPETTIKEACAAFVRNEMVL